MIKQVFVFIMIYSLSSFCGVIQNRKTEKRIYLDLYQEQLEFSFGERGERQILLASEIKPARNVINLYSASHLHEKIWWNLGDYETSSRSYLLYLASIPAILVTGVIAIAYDASFFIFKTSAKFIKNAKTKKDVLAIMKAASSDEEIIVGKKRFNRIKGILKGQQSI